MNKRNYTIYREAIGGKTLAQVGQEFGISRQRVSAIVKAVQAELGPDAKDLDRSTFPVKLAGFWVSPSQGRIIDNAPGQNYSQKIRWLIDQYQDGAAIEKTAHEKYSVKKGGCYISSEQKMKLDNISDNVSKAIRIIIDYQNNKE